MEQATNQSPRALARDNDGRMMSARSIQVECSIEKCATLNVTSTLPWSAYGPSECECVGRTTPARIGVLSASSPAFRRPMAIAA